MLQSDVSLRLAYFGESRRRAVSLISLKCRKRLGPWQRHNIVNENIRNDQ